MPLSPSATRELLLKLDHRPKKKLGQNFLIDGNIVQKSIAMAELREGMDVLEVGPGLGTLTQELLNHGQRVHAVEFDAKLTGNLRERFAPSINHGKLLPDFTKSETNLAGQLPSKLGSSDPARLSLNVAQSRRHQI